MNAAVYCTFGLLALISILTTIVLIFKSDVLNLGLIVKQITSGRWLLTVAMGISILVATLTDAWIAVKYASLVPAVTLPFPVSTIFAMASSVITFYFVTKTAQKDDTTGGDATPAATQTNALAKPEDASKKDVVGTVPTTGV